MWRDTARSPQLFFLDYRASFAIILVILHLSLWTLGIAATVMLLIAFIQRYDYTPPVALRYLRSLYAGPDRPAMDLGMRAKGSVWRRRWLVTRGPQPMDRRFPRVAVPAVE